MKLSTNGKKMKKKIFDLKYLEYLEYADVVLFEAAKCIHLSRDDKY